LCYLPAMGLTYRTGHVYGEANHAAGTWKRERRVIIKAEVARARLGDTEAGRASAAGERL